MRWSILPFARKARFNVFHFEGLGRLKLFKGQPFYIWLVSSQGDTTNQKQLYEHRFHINQGWPDPEFKADLHVLRNWANQCTMVWSFVQWRNLLCRQSTLQFVWSFWERITLHFLSDCSDVFVNPFHQGSGRCRWKANFRYYTDDVDMKENYTAAESEFAWGLRWAIWIAAGTL